MGEDLEVIEQLEGEFDIIRSDVDKEDYPKAFEAAVSRLRKGGILITDNVLWSGRIMESTPIKNVPIGVKEHNHLAFSDPRVLTTIVSIRDGLGVSLRLQ